MNRSSQPAYEFDLYRIDLENRLLFKGREIVRLRPKEFDVLLALVEAKGEPVKKDDLVKEIWPNTFVEENTVRVHIANLRKALREVRDNPKYILRKGKQGYYLGVEVKERWAYEEDFSASTPSTYLPIAINRHKLRLLITIALILFAAGVIYYVSKPLPPPRVLHPLPITNDGRLKPNPIVTDGVRLYFSEVVDGNKLLFQMVSTGGEIEKVTIPFANSVLLDISPDHTELLIGSEATIETEMRLWVLKVPGNSPHPLSDLHGHAGTWSPDRKHIVYANGSKLYLANSDGGDSSELVNVQSGLPYNLRWSPDGKLLRCEVRDLKDRTTSLWEMKADGTGLHPLLPGWNRPAAECCGNWTADGKYFVFQATRNQITNIWAIREKAESFGRANHEPIQLTDGPMSFRSPVPSKDGHTLFAIGEERLGEMVRYDAKAQQWVSYLPGISADYLDFSSDGERIAYVTYPEDVLWISKVDGRNRRQLTFPPMRAYSPHWSPDGRHVAFAAMSPGTHWKIYLISVEGDGGQQVISGDENQLGPVWSPDGSTLAFYRGDRALDTTAIYFFDLKTQRISMLPGSEGLYAPRWSPKGDYIAAIPDNTESLMLYDLNERKWNELVRINVANPTWSRDGKYIYFRSFYHDDPAVFRVRIEDHKLERWAALKDLRRASGPFGPWMGLAPDDSVLVLRDIGIQNIYAFDLQSP